MLKVLFVLVLVLEIVLVPIFLKYYWPKKCKKSLLFKTLSSTMFVLLGVLAMNISENNTPYAKLMIWGLIFGWIGDVFLHSLKDKMWHFAVGLVAFFTGHVFYIIAFQKAIETTYPGSPAFAWYEILAIVATIAIMAVICQLKNIFKDRGAIVIAVMVYGGLLVFMLTKAMRYAIGEIMYGTNDYMVLTFIFVVIGALLFVLSDGSLGIILGARKHNRKLRIFNILTYYAAQTLLASSIFVVFSSYSLY